MFQKESALAKWFEARSVDGPRGVRKTMIVAMARKLLIDLWRFVEDGVVPAGVVLFDPGGGAGTSNAWARKTPRLPHPFPEEEFLSPRRASFLSSGQRSEAAGTAPCH